MNGSIMKIAGYEALEQNVAKTKEYVRSQLADSNIALASTMHIGGETQTTVQQALGALNDTKAMCVTIPTKAEWDSMSDEEKNDPTKVYFLPWLETEISYRDISDKPQIEGHTLIGNMSLSDIGDVPISDSDIISMVSRAFGN